MTDILNHVRNCIREEIKACLSGCKHYRVYCGALENYCSPEHVSDNRAAINIRLGNESVVPNQRKGIGGCNNQTSKMNLQVTLEVYSKRCEGVEAFLDSVCAEAQRKMCNCAKTGDACHQISYIGTEPTRLDAGNTTYHLCRVYYEVTYIADACDMSKFIGKG